MSSGRKTLLRRCAEVVAETAAVCLAQHLLPSGGLAAAAAAATVRQVIEATLEAVGRVVHDAFEASSPDSQEDLDSFASASDTAVRGAVAEALDRAGVSPDAKMIAVATEAVLSARSAVRARLRQETPRQPPRNAKGADPQRSTKPMTFSSLDRAPTIQTFHAWADTQSPVATGGSDFWVPAHVLAGFVAFMLGVLAFWPEPQFPFAVRLISGLIVMVANPICVFALFQVVIRRARNRYELYVAEQWLKSGDHVEAAAHAFRIGKKGVPHAHYAACLASIAQLAEEHNDLHRANALRDQLRRRMES